MNRYDLEGKTAIITGAAGGIGLAIARVMAASGARVALWDLDVPELDRARDDIGTSATHARVDVTNQDDIAAAFEAASETMGAIDILINSAGIMGLPHRSADYPVDMWRKVIDINLTGTFLCCRAVLPGMIKRQRGRIINIASIAAKEGAMTLPAYAASKAGVVALTKTLGFEYARTGVTVNAIAPAAVKTEILAKATPEQLAVSLSRVPMGRLGTVDEIARLACWMASDDCSFTTGHVFDASGGRAFF